MAPLASAFMTDSGEMELPRLFVGGTGRSGTTRMIKVLGSHRLVYAVPWESRFIVDPGGLEDLARALTTGYTPYAAADALRRLSVLLGEQLTGRTMDCFRGWAFVRDLGPPRYWQAVDDLWRSLVWYEFDEAIAPAGYLDGQQLHLPHERASNRRVVGRYYADRAELMAILRRFVSALFDSAAGEACKRTWAEKTPLNMLSGPFLWELLPQSRLIHMIRDPVAVVASHRDQPWAPGTLEGAMNWVEPMYRRWLGQRADLLADERYVEVRLEDVSQQWAQLRPGLLARLGLPDDDQMLGFDSLPATRRAGQLPAPELSAILRRFSDIRDELGYA
jgi:omega-hydroxy-beta-dihydromenaquinone-9 sulfotransferase